MKASAQRTFQQARYDSAQGVVAKGYAIRDITGAAALLYILEPDRKAEYTAAIRGTLRQWAAHLAELKSGLGTAPNKWLYKVPSSSAFFNSVLALDVIHPDLTASEQKELEGLLGPVAEWFWESTSSWDLADYGVRATWALYTNDSARKELAMKQYRERLFSYFSPDGVYMGGTEYPHGRLGGERTAKVGFMHVAEFTGADPIYYRSPVLQQFYEWLYTFSLNPFNQIVTFGDAGHGRYFETLVPVSSAFGATNFTDRAGALAAYRMRLPHHPDVPGDLLSYCITRKPLPAAKPPQSQFWRDGGAVFWENKPTPEALMGALYNVSGNGGHLHKDANAIYLAGYGETLLANSGYNGYGNGFGGYDFKYIQNNAISSNTVTIQGENHDSPLGDGVSEGIITEHFNYASARADRALGPRAAHQRNFFFIAPQDGQNGYFALVDEVTTAQPGQVVQVNWHPMAEQARPVRPDEHFSWLIQRQKQTPTQLSIFLGTPPQAGTELKKGVLAGWKESFVGTFLQANYRSNPTGQTNIVTVLFPHDSLHALPRWQRIGGRAYSGGQVSFRGGITDTILESTGTESVVTGSATFQGTGALYRRQGDELLFYFIRKGKQLRFSGRESAGFTAEQPISLYLRKGQGKVISPGTSVTFRGRNLKRVRLDGKPLSIQKKSPGQVTVFVPAGDFQLQVD